MRGTSWCQLQVAQQPRGELLRAQHLLRTSVAWGAYHRRPVHYFRARRAVVEFGQFCELVDRYWQAIPPADGSFWASSRPESEESWQLRQQIQWALPKIVSYASELGVETTFMSGSRAAGFLPINALALITEEEHRAYVSRSQIADLLTRCRGAAQQELHRSFWRLVIPVYWLVDILGLVVRFPFLVLRAARLSSEWENTMAGQLIKVLELLAIIGIAVRFGLQLDAVAKVLGR